MSFTGTNQLTNYASFYSVMPAQGIFERNSHSMTKVKFSSNIWRGKHHAELLPWTARALDFWVSKGFSERLTKDTWISIVSSGPLDPRVAILRHNINVKGSEASFYFKKRDRKERKYLSDFVLHLRITVEVLCRNILLLQNLSKDKLCLQNCHPLSFSLQICTTTIEEYFETAQVPQRNSNSRKN